MQPVGESPLLCLLMSNSLQSDLKYLCFWILICIALSSTIIIFTVNTCMVPVAAIKANLVIWFPLWELIEYHTFLDQPLYFLNFVCCLILFISTFDWTVDNHRKDSIVLSMMLISKGFLLLLYKSFLLALHLGLPFVLLQLNIL